MHPSPTSDSKPMADQDSAIRPLADVATLALEEARRAGATHCEADVSVSQGLSVSVRLGEVDTAEYPYAGLVEPEALARQIPDLDLDHPWELSPEAAIELARTCEAQGLAVDARVSNSEGAGVSSQRHTGVYGNSLGFLAGYSSTSHSVSCTLIAQAGDDMQRDYWWSVARDPQELETAASVGRIAGERALARLGA